MPTSVQSNRAAASQAKDLLKSLPAKQSEASSSMPFKKELAKAQRASEKPKPEAKAEEPVTKKTSRTEKKSDAKVKKLAKLNDADDQPVEEIDATESADQPKPADDVAANEEDTTDVEESVDQPKVKAEAKTAATDAIDANTTAAAAMAQAAQATDQPQPVTEDVAEGASAGKPQVIAVQANDPAKAQEAKAAMDDAAPSKTDDAAAAGNIDLSQLEDLVADANETDASNETPAKPQAAEASADPVKHAPARPQAKVATDPQPVAIQPVQQQDKNASSSHQQMSSSDQPQEMAEAIQMLADDSDGSTEATDGSSSRRKIASTANDSSDLAVMMQKTPDPGNVTKPAAPAPPAPPEAQFASANHDKIITGLKSELMPNGGTMHIRLDPPELGALQVKVTLQDGVMTAAFETSNDDATKLLSHSLSQLKHALESQGVSVDKLHVQQSPRNESSSNQKDENGNPSGQSENHRSAQQEQQRKEMIRRMWRRLGVYTDPLDMVA